MRRLSAMLAVIALMAAPLALVARGEACAMACAKACCPISAHRTSTMPDGAHCHGTGGAIPGSMCCPASGNTHALDYGFATPLPLSILTAAIGVIPSQISRGAIAVANPLNFTRPPSPPFEPPRV